VATLTFTFGFDSMTPALKNQLVAPKFTELTSPNAPEIVNKRRPLLEMFVMNCHLSLFISNIIRQLVFNVIRKSESSFEEYSEAIDDLHRCVTAGHEVNSIRYIFRQCVILSNVWLT
jgi:hypothetical protein